MLRDLGPWFGRSVAAQAVFALLIGCTSPQMPALNVDGSLGVSAGRSTFTVNETSPGRYKRRVGPFSRSEGAKDERTFTANMQGTVASVALQVLGVELGFGVVQVGDLSKTMTWDTAAKTAEDIRDAMEAAVQAAGYTISYSGDVAVISEDAGATPSRAKAHVHLHYVAPTAMAQTIRDTFEDVRASASGRNLVISGSQKTATEAARMAVDLDVEHLAAVSWAVVDLPARVASQAVELVENLSWSEEGKTVEVLQIDDSGLVVVTGYSNGAVDEAVKLLESVGARDGNHVARTVSVTNPENALEAAKELFEADFDSKTIFAAADDEAGTVVVRGDPRVVGDVVQFLRTQGSHNDWVSVRAVVVETAVGSAVDRGLSLSWSNGANSAGLTFGGADPSSVKGGFKVTLGNDFKGALAWLQTDAHTRIVSKPSLSVRSGATASLNVGSQVPILDAQVNNTEDGQTVAQSVIYRDTGVSLAVKPKILSDGRISVVVEQEYSNASENTLSTLDSPVFNNRRLETEIAVQPGELAVIAGLEGAEFAKNHSGPKWLRGLGSHRRSQTRLAIFLTATIQDSDRRSQAAQAVLSAIGGGHVN